jgi:hypothetical protein
VRTVGRGDDVESAGSWDVCYHLISPGVGLFDDDRADPDVDAEGAQREFAMIARTNRLLDDGLAVGEQSGKQHASLDLRARHLGLVVDRLQRAAMNFQRRPSAFLRLNASAHLRQRLNDSRHRPA